MRYRRVPSIVEAVQFTQREDAERFMEQPVALCGITGDCFISTLEGVMRCQKGDWIVRGVAGEYFPVKPEIFAVNYEAVTE